MLRRLSRLSRLVANKKKETQHIAPATSLVTSLDMEALIATTALLFILYTKAPPRKKYTVLSTDPDGVYSFKPQSDRGSCFLDRAFVKYHVFE